MDGFHDRIGRIEGLVQKLEASPDPALRRSAKELVESLMELHGAGFERMLEISSEAGAGIVDAFGNDPLVSSLLILYGLHPDGFEIRVRRALEKVRPLLRAEDAHLDAIAIGETTVRVKIVGSESRKLEEAVREALLESAPDATEVIIEGTSLKGNGRASDFVPLTALTGAALTNP
jgi:hypothetical protein